VVQVAINAGKEVDVALIGESVVEAMDGRWPGKQKIFLVTLKDCTLVNLAQHVEVLTRE